METDNFVFLFLSFQHSWTNSLIPACLTFQKELWSHLQYLSFFLSLFFPFFSPIFISSQDPGKINPAQEQENFINGLCKPLYGALRDIFPTVEPCLEQMMSNLAVWENRFLFSRHFSLRNFLVFFPRFICHFLVSCSSLCFFLLFILKDVSIQKRHYVLDLVVGKKKKLLLRPIQLKLLQQLHLRNQLNLQKRNGINRKCIN